MIHFMVLLCSPQNTDRFGQKSSNPVPCLLFDKWKSVFHCPHFPSPLKIASFCWERMKVGSCLDEWVVIVGWKCSLAPLWPSCVRTSSHKVKISSSPILSLTQWSPPDWSFCWCVLVQWPALLANCLWYSTKVKREIKHQLLKSLWCI